MLAFTNSASLILIIRGYFPLCIHPIHPPMAPAIKCRFSPPLYQRTPLFPTTYYPRMAGACHCYAPNPTPRSEPGVSLCAQQAPWLVFLLPLRNQEKRKHLPTNSSFIDLNTQTLFCCFPFLLSSLFLSFLSLDQTLSVLVIVIRMHTIWVT